MKQYDAYLFDWDGTLAKTLEVWLGVIRNNFEHYGLHPTGDEIVSSFGNLGNRAVELGIKEVELDDFISRIEKESFELVPNADFYPGAYEVLERLRNNNKKLALITSGWRRTIEVILEKHNLRDFFDVIVTGDDVATHKPDPTGILRALNELRVDKVRAVMLGDSDKDLGAAKNAGIDSILFYPPSHQLFYTMDNLRLHQPTHIISGWDEVVL